ncbi:complex I NDUFA9 subunit family protein [Sphaerotilus sp.]|uniref:complex I NDUFA9 subunit family protein n=1 Tax=Sphaerotilus sp. TaxID=2093942 RepID=UPI00286D8F57|nr:complex I NDUFA9 subunit family protein [Sphaerotilus sp.]
MRKLLILGGTGFVGRVLVSRWMATPAVSAEVVLIPTRRRVRGHGQAMLPTVQVVEADVHDPRQLDDLVQGADAVVNLVAILHGSAAQFERTHVALPQQVAAACQRACVRRLVHVSALGVPDGDPASAPSHYLRSKARGEQVLRAAPDLDLTVLRPSVIFGAEDRFIRLFARLQALVPVMALAGAQARFQPVWVEDVAQALVHCLQDRATVGQTIECAGPEVLTLADLVRMAGRWSGHVRPVLPLPSWAGRLQAAALGLLPGEPLMSCDNLDSMRVPNVATGRHPDLTALGITPGAISAVMSSVLGTGFTPEDRRRTRAGRD